MSYNVYFEIDTGAGEVAEPRDGDRNYTRNVSPMWSAAIGENLGDLINRLPAARDLLPRVQRGVSAMETSPETYRAMNPDNGWGDYDGALAYLRWIADMCRTHPACTVRVSR